MSQQCLKAPFVKQPKICCQFQFARRGNTFYWINFNPQHHDYQQNQQLLITRRKIFFKRLYYQYSPSSLYYYGYTKNTTPAWQISPVHFDARAWLVDRMHFS